jgi:hypothetical protein
MSEIDFTIMTIDQLNSWILNNPEHHADMEEADDYDDDDYDDFHDDTPSLPDPWWAYQ